MSCCKDNLTVIIKIDDFQKLDDNFLHKVENLLMEHLEFTEPQSKSVVDFAKTHGKCRVFEGNREEVSNIITTLAKNSISAEVEQKSVK